ncbi:MAG: septum formation protein Maf [Chlamydiales bacterium]|nr:septum formation protein Maf [Chlamydiales bacterium]
MTLILGSSSPRRREMLDMIGIAYTACTPPFDERAFVHSGDAYELAKLLAEEKCASLVGEFPNEPILCADTLVVLDNEVYGKPDDASHAFEMLKKLSGRTHKVLTGVAIRQDAKVVSGVAQTDVTIKSLTDDQIRAFHKAINPLDKAGAYAAQGIGALILERIEGAYDNVVGLPMQLVMELLKQMEIDIWDYVLSLSSS